MAMVAGGPSVSSGAGAVARVATAILVIIAMITACEPTTPPTGAGTQPPASSEASGPPSGTSVITVTAGVVEIIGTGNNTTEEFELPAGEAAMTVSTCSSNQVIPFVTIYDGKDNKLGLIVEALYTVKNLAGGPYYLTVQSNPTCTWTITLAPG
jgi:hypothetical protein